MKKVYAVARAEYLIAATSKAFIVGIIMMPVFMGGAMVVQHFTKDQIDISSRRLAIVDDTARIGKAIEQHAARRNEHEIYSQEEGEERKQTQPEFLIEIIVPDADSSERVDVQLTNRVKSGDLYAYAIIEENVFDVAQDAVVRYHSQTPSYRTLPNWLETVVNAEIKRDRTQKLGLSDQDLAVLMKETPLKMFGLVTQDASGEVTDAKEESRILTFAVPFVGMMLMFMMIMSVSPAMLNNVLEEKLQKISEFLVSSVTPFELMLGKLGGAIGIGLTLSAIYLGAAYGMAVYFEIADSVPLSMYAWFLFFLLIALVIFGSIFSAVGAACSEIRDAQSLMTPVILMVIIPVMCIGPVFDSPSSTFSRVVSLIPPATPMLMFARIAIPPGPEAWEIVLAVVLSVSFAAFCLFAAGKIFRIGILSQGQAPTFAKMLQWIVTK